MYDVSISLTTPFVADDEDVVFRFSVPQKRDVRKIERVFMKALDHLNKLSDDALDKPSGVFEGSDPQEVHFIYEVTKGGVKWTKATHEWPGQTDVARKYLNDMLDGMMDEVGQKQAKQKRKKGGRA